MDMCTPKALATAPGSSPAVSRPTALSLAAALSLGMAISKQPEAAVTVSRLIFVHTAL